jgi:hypothetical protein
MDLQNQIQTPGANNSPGFGQVVIIARYADIETLPLVLMPTPEGAGDLADLATISSNVITKPGKKFIKLQTNNETTSIVDKIVGETSSKSFESSLELSIPILTAEALGFITAIKNDRIIAWAKDLEGNIRMIGSDAYPCILKDGESNSGKDRGSKKGIMLTLECVATNPAPFFTGLFLEGIAGDDANNITDSIWKV